MKQYLFTRLLFLFMISGSAAYAQVGVGGSAIINLQTKSIGAGIRAEIPKGQFVFAPQAAYYPSFNKIHEMYLGGSVHWIIGRFRQYMPYVLVNGSFNGWFNHASAPHIKSAKFPNWAASGGVGITTKRCIRPFAEYRYNLRWRETNFRIGVIFTFNCQRYVCNTYM